MKATLNPAYPACLQEISAASFLSQQRLPVYDLNPAAYSSYTQIRLSMHPKPTQRLATYPTPMCTCLSSIHMLSYHSCFVVRVWRMWSTLGRIEPFNVPQPPPDLSFFNLRPRKLLLFLRLELHIRVVFCPRVCRRCSGAADSAADIAGSRPRVLEAI